MHDYHVVACLVWRCLQATHCTTSYVRASCVSFVEDLLLYCVFGFAMTVCNDATVFRTAYFDRAVLRCCTRSYMYVLYRICLYERIQSSQEPICIKWMISRFLYHKRIITSKALRKMYIMCIRCKIFDAKAFATCIASVWALLHCFVVTSFLI